MQIDARLIEDSIEICNLTLSQLRLMRDGDVDWFLLIPLREEVKDWCDLSIEDQLVLTREIDYVSRLVKETKVDKINVASLGNLVSQLHIHIIGRLKADRAWPRPIWGTSATRPFDPTKVNFWKNKMMESPWAY